MSKFLTFLLVLPVLLAGFSSCERSVRERTTRGRTAQSKTYFALGTVCRISLFEGGSGETYKKVENELDRLESIFSARDLKNGAVSDLQKINNNAGMAPVAVSGELILVLSRALEIAGATLDAEGFPAFNPAIGPLVELWGIGTEGERVPSDEEISAVLPLLDFRKVSVDARENTVFLEEAGMALDLGAIAKGYAGDRVASILRENAVERALIDLGGNIYALGAKSGRAGSPNAVPWRVGIQHPERERGEYVSVIDVTDACLVTSGIYERFFESGGIRYHHILSTRRGFPADGGALSVTIIAPASADASADASSDAPCMDSDALSTALFALDYDAGKLLLESQFPAFRAIYAYPGGKLKTVG